MYSDKANLTELLLKHDTTSPLLAGVLSTTTNTTTSPSYSHPPSPSQIHAHAQQSQSPAQLHPLHAIAQGHAHGLSQSAHVSHAQSAQTQGGTQDTGIIHVHRQLVRTLSKLLATACDSLSFMEMLVVRVILLFIYLFINFVCSLLTWVLLQQVFPSIIAILKQGPSRMLPTVLCLELSQLLVFALKVLFMQSWYCLLLTLYIRNQLESIHV